MIHNERSTHKRALSEPCIIPPAQRDDEAEGSPSYILHRTRSLDIGELSRNRLRTDHRGAESPINQLRSSYNRMAVMRGTGVLISNSLPGAFQERRQELTSLIKRLSSHVVIPPVEKAKFELELRNYHVADVRDLASHFSTRSVYLSTYYRG
jgi:hypothetical protein